MLVDNHWAGVSRAVVLCWRLMAYCAALDNVVISSYLTEIWSTVTSLGFSSTRKMMTSWKRAGEWPLRQLGGDHDITKSLREEHLFRLSISRLRRYPIVIFSYVTGEWKQEGTKLFSEVQRIKVCQGKFWLVSYLDEIIHKERCSVRTWALSGRRISIPGNTQSSAGHSPEQSALYILSWLHCELEVGQDDLQRKGSFSPEFYDSSVLHDMCAKTLSALNIITGVRYHQHFHQLEHHQADSNSVYLV